MRARSGSPSSPASTCTCARATCAKAVALLPPAGRGAKVGDVKVHGARATAFVDGFDRPLVLVREDGSWRVESTPSGETD